jgi:hypothetical protein
MAGNGAGIRLDLRRLLLQKQAHFGDAGPLNGHVGVRGETVIVSS